MLTLLKARPVRAAAEAFARVAAGEWEMPEALRGDRLAGVSGLSLQLALSDAGLLLDGVDRERVGVALGSAWAGVLGMIDFAGDVRSQSSRFVSPLRFPQTVGNFAAGAVARAFGLRGPNVTTSCGAGSGLAAIHEALRLLEQNRADVMIAGGADVLSAELVRGLDPTDGPFSEGACLLVLERSESAGSRGARIRGWLSRAAAGSPGVGADVGAPNVGSERTPFADVDVAAWTGQCFAALGPATAAFVLGAWDGHPISPPQRATVAGKLETANAVSARCLSIGTVVSAGDEAFSTVIRPWNYHGQAP